MGQEPKWSVLIPVITALVTGLFSAAVAYYVAVKTSDVELAKLNNQSLEKKQEFFLSRCKEIKSLHQKMNDNLFSLDIAEDQKTKDVYTAKLNSYQYLAVSYFGKRGDRKFLELMDEYRKKPIEKKHQNEITNFLIISLTEELVDCNRPDSLPIE